MKRYQTDSKHHGMEESKTGDWVKYSDVEELVEESNKLTHLFELQHERSLEADKLWQKATGNAHVLPERQY